MSTAVERIAAFLEEFKDSLLFSIAFRSALFNINYLTQQLSAHWELCQGKAKKQLGLTTCFTSLIPLLLVGP